jgi:DNA-binding NtrC family response regulator
LDTHAIGPEPVRSRRHLLFVDDEPSIVSAYTRLLGRRGYLVTGHTDPRAALADFEARPTAFDACLLDHWMPGLDGIALARALRRLRSDLCIAMTSGYGAALGPEAREAGVRELLAKPYALDELVTVLERLVG